MRNLIPNLPFKENQNRHHGHEQKDVLGGALGGFVVPKFFKDFHEVEHDRPPPLLENLSVSRLSGIRAKTGFSEGIPPKRRSPRSLDLGPEQEIVIGLKMRHL
jgi:hypothetical protein